MIRLYLYVHGDSIESFGAKLNLNVLLPLMVVERSKKIHRRDHYAVVSNAVKETEKTTNHKKREKVRSTTCTFGACFTPDLVNQEILINNSFSQELCGKLSASGAEVEFFEFFLLKLLH